MPPSGRSRPGKIESGMPNGVVSDKGARAYHVDVHVIPVDVYPHELERINQIVYDVFQIFVVLFGNSTRQRRYAFRDSVIQRHFQGPLVLRSRHETSEKSKEGGLEG